MSKNLKVNLWPPFKRSGTTITQRTSGDNVDLLNGNLHFNDDAVIRFGNTLAAPDVSFGWNTTQTVDALFLGLATAQNTFLIAENGDVAFDFAHGAQTNPTLFIHSATQSTTQWISLTHNQTNGVISAGAGLISIPEGIITPSIQSVNAIDSILTLQSQVFTSGATHNAIEITPQWTAEDRIHRAVSLSATQIGANSQSLTGQLITVNKNNHASTLATMTALQLSMAVGAAGTVTLSTALDIIAPTGGQLTTAYGIAIANQSLGGGTTAYGIQIASQTANATTTRAINIAGTGANNAIFWGGSALQYSTGANNIRFADSTNVDGLDFTLSTTSTTINTATQTASSLIFQNQTFAAGATHSSVTLSPTWATENFLHNALAISPTQNGANSNFLNAINITMNKATGATTLASMGGLYISAPVIAGTVTNSYGIYIADQSNAGTTTAYGIFIASQGAPNTKRGICFQGTSSADVIQWGETTGLIEYAPSTTMKRFATTNLANGIDLGINTGASQTISTVSVTTGTIVIQEQTFTAGQLHEAVKISPTWATENFGHRALQISPTQNGANNQSLEGIQISMTKATGATTLASMTGLIVSAPNVSGTVTASYAFDIGDQTNANITTPRFLRTQSGVANAWVVGNSPLIYSSGAEVINFRDSTDTGGLNFTLTAASSQTISSLGNLVLNPSTGIIDSTNNAAFLNFNIPITGADAGGHVLALQLDSNSIFSIGGTGDGAGGILGTYVSMSQVSQSSGTPPYFFTTGAGNLTNIPNASETGASYFGTGGSWSWVGGAATLTQNRHYYFNAPTYNAGIAGFAITDAATMYISGAPTAGSGNITLTRAFGLWNGGKTRLDNLIDFGSTSAAGDAITTSRFQTGIDNSGNFISYIPTSEQYIISGGSSLPNIHRSVMQSSGAWVYTQAPAGSGATGHFALYPGEHSNLTASTEVPDFWLALGSRYDGTDTNSGQVSWAAGNITTQRAVRIGVPNYSISGGASTFTNVALFDLDAAITGNSGTIITNNSILRIGANVNFTTTMGTTASLTYRPINLVGHVLTLSGATQLTGTPSIVAQYIGQITVTNTSNANTIDNAASLYLAGAPTASGAGGFTPVITNAYALWSDAGTNRFDGTVQLGASGDTAHSTTFYGQISNGNSGSGYHTTASSANSIATMSMGISNGVGAATLRTGFNLTGTSIPLGNAAGTLDALYGIYVNAMTFTQSANARVVTTAVGGSFAAPYSTNANTTFGTLSALSAGANLTLYQAATNLYRDVLVPSHTVTLATTTQMTGTPGIAEVMIGTLTVNQSGGAVIVDNGASLYIASALAPGGSVTITNNYSLFVDSGPSRFDGAIIGSQGTDIASASTIVIPIDGNTFELTGTTAVNLITTTGYQDGHEIMLVANENVTINHGTATSGANVTILLAGAGNFAMTANDTLTLRLCTTTANGQAWREKCRTAI